MLSAGDKTFLYDLNRNTTKKTVPGLGETSYSYNYENKITTILYPSGRGVSNYLYDGDGVRRKKMDGAGTRCFVYDGANLIAETDAFGNLQVVYTYGVDGLASSHVYSPSQASYFYHFDGLGSTRAMTNAQAQLVEVYDYEAFGNELLGQGELTTPYRYVGQLGYYRHDDVELDLLGARWYAPEFGRFLTRDPMGVAAAPNLYSYVENSPAGSVDPEGLRKRYKHCERIPWIGRKWPAKPFVFRHACGFFSRDYCPLWCRETYPPGSYEIEACELACEKYNRGKGESGGAWGRCTCKWEGKKICFTCDMPDVPCDY
jgi:RHS repeat-associated protein